MANLTRNAAGSGTNKPRGGYTSPNSHLWDESNTPWDPDSNLPWEDETLMPSSFPDGINKVRN